MSDSMPASREALERAYALTCQALLAERSDQGYWLGELASSALATATAVSSLSLMIDPELSTQGGGSPVAEPVDGNDPAQLDRFVQFGLRWLTDHQNPDGGWGDTTGSLSNISTTMLVRVAF